MVANKKSSVLEITTPANGFRFFRPGIPARVEMREGLPGHIFFQGLRGEIVAASGPWRTSGDWWQDSWDQAEWDVEIQFASAAQKTKRPGHPLNPCGLYLLYYDSRQQSWFLRGTYD